MHQQVNGFGCDTFTTLFSGVDHIRKFEFVQIVDGLEEFDVPEDVIIWRNHHEHPILFAPKAGLLEFLSKGRLGKNTARKVIATIIDVEMKGIELIEICFLHEAKSDGLTFKHDFLLSTYKGLVGGIGHHPGARPGRDSLTKRTKPKATK